MTNKPKKISLGFTYKRFEEGAHLCLIYRDETERRRMVSKYIESGLLNNEKIDYFADTMTKKEVSAWLKEVGVELPETNQVAVSPTVPTYCPKGKFIPQDMLQRLCNCYDRAIAEGFTGSRITGETNWTTTEKIPGLESFIEYEASINSILDTHPITVMCQYDATKFDGGALFDILQVHPLLIVRGQIVKNPAYIRPEEFLKEYRGRS